MRIITLTAALVLMVVAPAAAQQSGSSPTGAQAEGQKGTSPAGGQGGKSDVSAMSQQKLQQSLQTAGFKDIKIVDAAYVVHARTQDGNFVVMYIDPPTTIQQQGTTGSASAGSTGHDPAQKR